MTPLSLVISVSVSSSKTSTRPCLERSKQAGTIRETTVCFSVCLALCLYVWVFVCLSVCPTHPLVVLSLLYSPLPLFFFLPPPLPPLPLSLSLSGGGPETGYGSASGHMECGLCCRGDGHWEGELSCSVPNREVSSFQGAKYTQYVKYNYV